MSVLLIIMMAVMCFILSVVLRVMSNMYKLNKKDTASSVCSHISYGLGIVAGVFVGWLFAMLMMA